MTNNLPEKQTQVKKNPASAAGAGFWCCGVLRTLAQHAAPALSAPQQQQVYSKQQEDR
jgi:hypothetical protein